MWLGAWAALAEPPAKIPCESALLSRNAVRISFALSNTGEPLCSPDQPSCLDEQLIVQQQWIELNLPALHNLTIGPLIFAADGLSASRVVAAINGRGMSYILLHHDSYVMLPLKAANLIKS